MYEGTNALWYSFLLQPDTISEQISASTKKKHSPKSWSILPSLCQVFHSIKFGIWFDEVSLIILS